MAHTDRLGLPLLAAGQAQKELTHNEALSLIDIALALTVESADLDAPPTAPEPGQCWIVASTGEGDWEGRDGQVAGWTPNGWRFLAPGPGWRGWVLDRDNAIRFDGTSWIDEPVRADGLYIAGKRIVGSREAPIPDATGGTTVDSEARASINGVLAVLRTHGLIEA